MKKWHKTLLLPYGSGGMPPLVIMLSQKFPHSWSEVGCPSLIRRKDPCFCPLLLTFAFCFASLLNYLSFQKFKLLWKNFLFANFYMLLQMFLQWPQQTSLDVELWKVASWEFLLYYSWRLWLAWARWSGHQSRDKTAARPQTTMFTQNMYFIETKYDFLLYHNMYVWWLWSMVQIGS